MRRLLPFALGLLCLAIPCAAENGGLLGYWREPSGSVIRIAPCGADLCATLAAVSPQAPTRLDIHNPDASLRQKLLCGLVIGRGFHATSPTYADGGSLYDPKSGKTYRGEMTANGDQLALRGYIGVKLFGRTETWTRTPAPIACST